jgi:hypothetical protein
MPCHRPRLSPTLATKPVTLADTVRALNGMTMHGRLGRIVRRVQGSGESYLACDRRLWTAFDSRALLLGEEDADRLCEQYPKELVGSRFAPSEVP